MKDDELTPLQVAKELGVAPATVRRWEKRGVLKPGRRLPGKHGHRRYNREDVEALKQSMIAAGQG